MHEDTITLGEAREQIVRDSRWNHDELLDVNRIDIDCLYSIKYDRDRTHQLKENAQRQLCQRLGIPFAYMRKCPEDLQQLNMIHWLPFERNEQMFFRFNAQRDVRAIFTPRYVPVDDIDVITRLLETGYRRDTSCLLRRDDGFMSISIPDEKSRFTIAGREEFMHGVKISNSEIGLSSIRIEAWVLRIVCMNGMVAQETVGSYARRHVITGLVDALPVLIENARKSRKMTEERLTVSIETHISDREETMLRLNRQFGLSQKLQDTVKRASTGEEHTLFEMVNTYTRAAHYTDLTANESYRLEQVGGLILALGRRAA